MSTEDPDGRVELAPRARILREAWAMIEAGRIGDLTMAAVGKAAGVSRQTVYVQFGMAISQTALGLAGFWRCVSVS